LATVNRIADILSVQGDTDPIGLRRSKAIGILAQPALALHLLITHRDDADPEREPASEADRDAGGTVTTTAMMMLRALRLARGPTRARDMHR
jgi:hypothetical protein